MALGAGEGDPGVGDPVIKALHQLCLIDWWQQMEWGLFIDAVGGVQVAVEGRASSCVRDDPRQCLPLVLVQAGSVKPFMPVELALAACGANEAGKSGEPGHAATMPNGTRPRNRDAPEAARREFQGGSLMRSRHARADDRADEIHSTTEDIMLRTRRWWIYAFWAWASMAGIVLPPPDEWR